MLEAYTLPKPNNYVLVEGTNTVITDPSVCQQIANQYTQWGSTGFDMLPLNMNGGNAVNESKTINVDSLG
jgi:hypothetical protein